MGTLSTPDEIALLRAHDIARVRAPNPGPYTLSGTNSWIIGRDPAYLIDPGPAIAEHLDALLVELAGRGGLAAILLTHRHRDHSEGAPELSARTGAPIAASTGAPIAASSGAPVGASSGEHQIELADGDRIGPLTALATPGHASDHLAFVAGRVCFSGDTVLGEGSVFIAPDPGSLTGYLAALRRLRELDLELIAPGHGPLVTDPAAKLDHYLAHRLARERRVLEALSAGLRDREQLLDRVWPGLSPELRPIARATLEAHLGKLAEEGRLPDG